MKRLTVVGAGWAGLAAAVHATLQGWQVRLLEAAPHTGGRARRVTHQQLPLDNGQHILIGAYRETLRLMKTVGADPEPLLWRTPLNLRRIDGKGLQLPPWPAPWNLLGAIASAKGWRWQDKLAMTQHALRWQWRGFDCAAHTTVDELCRALPASVMSLLIEPLCVSALNLPPSQASAKVFLRVMRDAMWGGAGSSDMLIPRTDLGGLLPDAAVRWLTENGADVVTGHRVEELGQLLDEPLVLAVPAWEAAKLTAPVCPAWSTQAKSLSHTAITTVYLKTTQSLNWPTPVMALASDTDTPAQFAFDKGRVSGQTDMQGVLAMVVSHSGADRETTTAAVQQQARTQLGLRDASVLLSVVEKRASFACVPGLKRPTAQLGPHWVACGDYIDGPYPATLEGAVQSGLHAIRLLSPRRLGENGS